MQYLILFFVVIAVAGWIAEIYSNSKKYLELKPKLDNLEDSIKKHQEQIVEDKKQIADDKFAVEKLAKQKSMGFPWLAEVYAEYFSLKDNALEEYLKHKKHPAYSTAENVKIIKNEKKILNKQLKIVDYKLNYFLKLFPWLSDLIAEDESEEMPVSVYIDDGSAMDDSVRKYLTPEEYKSLPSVKRNQMALDRYLKNRNKSKWAIGRDYEMYVGYLYEQKGYSVKYIGIIDGFDDLGRDVVAKKDDEVCIIQCKRWAQYKEIHEKHIFQLFGTTMEYWIKNFKQSRKPKTFKEFSKILGEKKLKPIFFTSTKLSDRSRVMAQALSIEIIEEEPLGDFPRIKCNINTDKFGKKTKIYHLPMDQQYDKTIIGDHKGEFSAFTVKEAESAGFRRAFRHRFNS